MQVIDNAIDNGYPIAWGADVSEVGSVSYTHLDVYKRQEYNKLFRQGHLREEDGFVFLPYLVLIVDEFADLIMTTGRAIELSLIHI